jgi:predicted DNA-binding protein
MDAFSLKLPSELAHWLEERSRATGRAKSEIVREAVERLRGAAKNGSALDAAGEAVGSVDSGHGDLGSNKARLRGFGR